MRFPDSTTCTAVLASHHVVMLHLLSTLQHIGARRRRPRRKPLISRGLRRRPQLAGALPEPIPPVIPPRAGPLLGAGQPLLGIDRMLGVGEKARLRVAGRVHDTLNMAARAQDELARPTQDLRCGITRLP